MGDLHTISSLQYKLHTVVHAYVLKTDFLPFMFQLVPWFSMLLNETFGIFLIYFFQSYIITAC